METENEFIVTAESSATAEVYITTRKLTEMQSGAVLAAVGEESGNSDIYAATGIAVLSSEKAETDSKELAYVTATITLYWRDNLGISNDFLGASGGWTKAINPATNSSPYTNNTYCYLYAAQATVAPFDDTISVSGSTFYIDADAMPKNYHSYSVTSYIDIYDSYSDYAAGNDPEVLDLEVRTVYFG